MYSIKKWIASKINPSNENGEYSEAGRSNAYGNYSNHEQSSSQQLPFDVSNGAKTILQFYYSDDELNMIASELVSFDGRRDPLRCTELVSQLRVAQDKVMQLLFQLMDEWGCTRASRDYRLKFPEDLLNDSENGESFNGQIWFSAECLASGSDIMNHEAESDMLRPLAKILTNNLDQLRIMLRQSSNEISNKVKFYQDLIHRMEQFDRMFSAFEFEYVKAMLPIKSVEDIEKQQELTVLFSESLGFALKRNLITQIDVDEFNPSVMIALPRLAIVHGLVRCGNDNPLFRRHKHNLSNMFKSYHSSLHRIHGMLKSLRPIEIFMLEKLLSNEESLTDCVDSMFEEPGSFKQYNEFDFDYNYSSERINQSNANSSNVKFESISNAKFIKRSTSLPNLTNINKLNSKECNQRLNMTVEDQITDEIDASFKTITKRLKKCASQFMTKRQASTNDLDFYRNNQINGLNESTVCHQLANQRFLNVNHQQFNNSLTTSSQQSTSLTVSTSSSVDSYEISLALSAKRSNYISATAKQMLHKLFVSISGIADQLQSNFACDLRQILKLVFILHTSAIDEADCTVLEEALESTNFTSTKTSNFEEMLNNSENLQLLFSTTLNAIENAQTNNLTNLPEEESVDQFNYNHADYSENNELEDIYENNIYENYSNDCVNHQDSMNRSINQAGATEDLTRYQPLWVPDEQTSDCTKCKTQFTLLRRRHHCRSCGKIFCNSCSRHFICLAHIGYNKPIRVCDSCYLVSNFEIDGQSSIHQSLL